jgi:hypothetical protein
MAVSNEVNRVKFVAEDFETYRSEADAFFQANYPEDFNNAIATDIGNAMLDQLAFAMQSISFMVNRRASEMFLSTARLNKSITKLARMLGYPIQPAAPASTDLTITFTSGPYLYPIIIPRGFQFTAPGDIVYEYQGAADFVVPPATTSVTIPIKEGKTKRSSFVSNGETNQQFSIFGIPSGQFLYRNETETSLDMVLTVDGYAWTRKDLIKYETTNTYEVLFTDDPPKLRFGDGITGNIPPINSQIVLSYRYGKGLGGAIGKDQITGTSIQLIVNNIVIPMTFANLVSNVGRDPEDIRHVRAFASSFFRTQNAAVIKSDYDTIAGLVNGVSLADAQIIRGVDNDITVQNSFTEIHAGELSVEQAVSGISASTVTGAGYAGVSGINFLVVGGTGSLGVSGIGSLGVSGTSVTGIQFLGVSGAGALFVGGTASLGVSGLQMLGISDQTFFISQSTSGINQIESGVTGLYGYLSQVFSDTSKANNVQMIILSSDANNKYISPSITTLNNVSGAIQPIADASVTVTAVDGISKIVTVNMAVEIGINQNAIKSDVQQKSLAALTGSVSPFGILVKRAAGKSLYVSDVEDAVRAANDAGDIRFINVSITGPTQYLDGAGNLIIGKQQIIQNGTVTLTVPYRFLATGEMVTA